MTHAESVMMAYDMLSDGRTGLLGHGRDEFASVIEGIDVWESNPLVFVDFPLDGTPCHDVMGIYTGIDRSREPSLFGPMIDWYAGSPHMRGTECGIEVDTSDGNKASAYLRHAGRVDLAVPFLESIGDGDMSDEYLSVFERLPDRWFASYVASFPERDGSPIRIGGMAASERIGRAEWFSDSFDSIGFSAYDDGMLSFCDELLAEGIGFEFQFDIMADGSLSDTFSISVPVIGDFKGKGMLESFAETVRRHDLADERWELLKDLWVDEVVDGTRMVVHPNNAKVKFVGRVPQVARCYVMMSMTEVVE